jgi:hypothetical protein
MTRKPTTVAFWCGKLPPWEIEEGRYFVTIHLAGAVPQVGRRRIRILAEEYRRAAQRASSDAIDLNRKIFAEMEKWLDRTPTSRQLGVPAVARMIEEAIENRVTRRIWKVFEYGGDAESSAPLFRAIAAGAKANARVIQKMDGA